MAAVRVKIAGEQKSLYILLKVQKMVWGEDCERLLWEPQVPGALILVPGVLRKWGGRKDVGAQDSLELFFLSLSPHPTHTFTHSPMAYSPSSGYIKCQNTVSVILEFSEIKFLLGILVCCLALKLSSLFSEIPVRRRAHKERQIHIQRFWTRWLKEGGTQCPSCSAVELSSLLFPSSSPLPGSSCAAPGRLLWRPRCEDRSSSLLEAGLWIGFICAQLRPVQYIRHWLGTLKLLPC